MKPCNQPFLLLFSFLVLSSVSQAQTAVPKQVVRVMYPPQSYFAQLVERSLTLTGVRGKYQLVARNKGDVSHLRLTKLLAKSEHIDIAGLGVTPSRMQKLRAIQQPLLFGLQGYRILLIHQDNLSRFENINSLAQLRKLQGGFVNGWADTQILLDNNLPIHTVVKAPNVYSMLAIQRVDYFPRSMQEVKNNFNAYVGKHPELAIESHLALYYPLPVYFFLSKQNEQLARHLEMGLAKLVSSGEMRDIFLSFYADKIAELNIEQRKVLFLENKTLSKDIVVSPAAEWLRQ